MVFIFVRKDCHIYCKKCLSYLAQKFIALNKESYHYKQIKKDKYKTEVINSWADDVIVNRDGNGKFIKEFQTAFNSCFWELYIYQCLKKLGSQFDLKHEHPDFVVTLPKRYQSFTVECTIASNANDALPEFDTNAKLNDETNEDDKLYTQVLRLSNSFASKYNKYKDSYSKEAWVKKLPYIIAIAPFEQPNAFMVGNEAILAILYGDLVDRKHKCYERIDGVYKQNGAEIDLGYFLKKEFCEVSGVFFSNVATIGKVDAVGNDPNCIFYHTRSNIYGSERIEKVSLRKPMLSGMVEVPDGVIPDFGWFYREKITDGLTLYLNPYAINPLNREILLDMYEAGINILRYDLDEMDFDESLFHDGFLLHRLVRKWNFTE